MSIAGNVDDIQFFADITAGREPDGSYTGNSNAAFTAINCLDYPMNSDIGVMRADEKALDRRRADHRQVPGASGPWGARTGSTRRRGSPA